MLRDLIEIANKLDSLGLTKEADFLDSVLLKAAQEKTGDKVLHHTSDFLKSLIINLNAIVRSADKRGQDGQKRIMEELKEISIDLYNAAQSGDYKLFNKIFKEGERERKLSIVKDPDYHSTILDRFNFGKVIGMDIANLSLSVNNMPITIAPSDFYKGMEAGIEEALIDLINLKRKEYERDIEIQEDKKKKLLDELSKYKELIKIKQDKDNPMNYTIRVVRDRYKEWHSENVSLVISPEKAKSLIEIKEIETAKKIEEIIPLTFQPGLTPEQADWARRLKIEIKT